MIVDSRGSFAGVDLLILDTASQMQEEYIDLLIEKASYGGKFREQLVPRSGVKDFRAVDVPGQPDYHVTRNAFRPVVRHLIQAPLDVILLAHVRDPGPLDKKPIRRPNITEATFNVIAREATFLGYMFKQGGKYQIDFEDNPTLAAKSQIPTIHGKIPTETLPGLLQAWKERVS
jgi:hypothetical protein